MRAGIGDSPVPPMIAAEQGLRSFDAASDAACAILLNAANLTVRVSPIIALKVVLFHCDNVWTQAREP